MPGSRPDASLIQPGQMSACSCKCGDVSFGPPVTCQNAEMCIAHCLQMYPGQCTVVNTYGCCGSSCQYFQSQSLDTRICTCNCANQRFSIPEQKCSSPQSCLTKCLTKFPQQCSTNNAQACCAQECQTYSQLISNACACRCQGNTYYPAPKCSNAEGCVDTCLTVSHECSSIDFTFDIFVIDI